MTNALKRVGVVFVFLGIFDTFMGLIAFRNFFDCSAGCGGFGTSLMNGFAYGGLAVILFGAGCLLGYRLKKPGQVGTRVTGAK